MAVKRVKPIEPLTAAEVEALIGAGSRRAPTGIRNRALIAVMYYAGLRLAEALALLPKDLDLDKGQINVLRGKGSKQRVVGINAAAAAHLERWMDRRRRLGVNGRHAVFCTLSGNSLNDRYVRAMLGRYALRAGIEKRVHPHGLRHSHAVHLDRKGVSVYDIKEQLGHSSLATTAGYLDSISPHERVRQIHELEW